MGFDFSGVFEEVVEHQHIHFNLNDDRTVTVEFKLQDNKVTLIETFEAEDEHSGEQQRLGWLAILENFKNYVEQQ